MGINAEDILFASDTLMTTGVMTSEPCLRSAASRAYYAVFHKAKEYAEKRGLQVDYSRLRKDPNSHEEVIFKFKHSSNSIDRNIGYELNQLKLSRATADYDLGYDFKYGEANTQICKAKSLIKRL
ncbi:hypothetical protein LQD23_03720 [Chromobacterium violaceum]|uniref:hypothetical protein n=1 Tax=Chromobacterium violaceum TaxID=536 RepID=UPI001E4D5EAA|nr:hypothetical protein [Chromobacterium violaceum]MCD0491401.1 hypothetical protein [Chromobacterium violaceum]